MAFNWFKKLKKGLSKSAVKVEKAFTSIVGKKTLDELISSESTLRSLKRIRYNFRKFFRGITIRNSHNFDIQVKGIDLSGNWKNFGVKFVPFHESNRILALFTLEADRLSLNIESFRIEDLQHEFIKKVGGDKLYIKLDQEKSDNLKLLIPVELEVNSQGEIDLTVKPIESNPLRSVFQK